MAVRLVIVILFNPQAVLADTPDKLAKSACGLGLNRVRRYVTFQILLLFCITSPH